MNKAILSYKYPQFASALRDLGYETIPSECVETFISYEQDHADMQCLIMDDTAFVLRCCDKLCKELKRVCKTIVHIDDIGHDYPRNVALNSAIVGKNIICNISSIDKAILDYCKINDYRIINVHQGYAKCSCAIVGDNAIITADKGIYRSVIRSETEIDTLLIGEGKIRLSKNANGFIGGASGYDKDTRTLYFCGEIEKHPDYRMIKDFCNKNGVSICGLSDDVLTDIGGIVFC